MVLMKPIKLPIDHKKYQEIGSFWVCQKTHLLSYVLQTFFDLLLGQQTINFGTVDTDLSDMWCSLEVFYRFTIPILHNYTVR